MRRFTAYRLWLMWDNIQAKYENRKSNWAKFCFWHKVRISEMYDLEL